MTELEQKEIQALRRLGIEGRLRRAFSMYDFARTIVTNTVREHHPDWPVQGIQSAVRKRMMSKD